LGGFATLDLCRNVRSTGLILRGLIYPLQWQLVTLPVCVGVFDVRMFNLLSCFMFFFLPGSSLYNSVLVLNVLPIYKVKKGAIPLNNSP
jgi:hypothetical protein